MIKVYVFLLFQFFDEIFTIFFSVFFLFCIVGTNVDESNTSSIP